MIVPGLPPPGFAAPVVIVGAGPAGIVLALELRRRGVAAVMLAGGGDGFDPAFQALADAEIAPWYVPAAAYLDAGEPTFAAPLPHLKPTAECRFDRLERWSGRRNLRRAHAAALERDPGLCVCLGPVATGLRIDPASGHVAGIELDMPDGRHAVLSARAVALACGGLETTRLLLVAQAAQPRLFGGPDGALG